MLFANCSLGDDSICRGPMVMLHKTPSHAKEWHNPPPLILWAIHLNSICGSNGFHLQRNQMAGTN